MEQREKEKTALFEIPQTRIEEVRERWDILASVVLLSLGIFGLFVVQNFEQWRSLIGNESTTVTVGTLSKESGAVRQRRHSSLIWRDISEQSTSVSGGDSIFTGEDGSAQLSLVTGQNIGILPGSLVVIPMILPKPGEAGQLNLVEGSLQLDIKDQSKNLAVKVGDKTYELASGSAGRVEVQLDPENPQNSVRFISQKDATIQIKTPDNQLLNIKAGETASIDKSGRSQVNSSNFDPISPARKENVLADAAQPRARFTWKSSGPIREAGDSLKLEIADKTEFAVKSSTTELTVNLAPGQYRWRMKWADPKSGAAQSPWVPFRVTALEAPKIQTPANRAKLSFVEKTPRHSVSFRWKKAHPNVLTTVEIRKKTDQQGQAQPSAFASSSTEGLSQELAFGEYEWRALSRINSGAKSQPTAWRSFSVVESQPEKLSEEKDRRTELEKARQEAARKEAQRKAAEEAARREAQRAAQKKAAEEAAKKSAQEAARKEAQRKAAEEAARKAAQKKAAEEAARREAVKKATTQGRRPGGAPEVPARGPWMNP